MLTKYNFSYPSPYLFTVVHVKYVAFHSFMPIGIDLERAITDISIVLTVYDINPLVGSLNLDINTQMDSPIDITLIGYTDIIPIGTDFTIVAATSITIDSYQ